MRRAGSHRGHLEGVVCASVVQVVTHAGNKQGKDLHVPGWAETEGTAVSHSSLLHRGQLHSDFLPETPVWEAEDNFFLFLVRRNLTNMIAVRL